MSLFRRKDEEPEKLNGTRIIEYYNSALDKTRYRVWTPGWIHAGIPPRYEDFDDYEKALTHYHELTGWETVREEQP